jgi:hypothetical protein
MKALKPKTSKLLKYLREVSVVIVGVAVTLWGTNRITDRNEQREITMNLNAIKEELKRNETQLASAEDYFRGRAAYSRYLKTYPKKELHADSIRRYAGYIYNYFAAVCQTSAFESFKNSGLMPKMRDKLLMREIWSVYSAMDLALQAFEKWEQKKDEYVKEDYASMDFDASGGYLNDIIPLYIIHVTGGPIANLQYCQYYRTIVNDVIAMLEEATAEK